MEIITNLNESNFELLIDYNNFALQLAEYKLEQWNTSRKYRLANNILDATRKLKNQQMTTKTFVGAHLDKIFLLRPISDIVLNYLFLKMF
jgi:hypothetical protein